MSDPRPDHYSYALYADAAMAERFEGLRFSGPIGRLIAATQERVIAGFLDPVAGRTVLDVGTGTGRGAIALARRGAIVTGVDASQEMLDVARRQAEAAGVPVTFAREDAHRLPFADGAFDSVICLRVLMHTPDWRRSLAELCRVARDRVVFDYPAMASAALLESLARRLAHAAGARVEAYRVFAESSVRHALAAEGYRLDDIHRQFVLPIALHKRINSEAGTRRVERALQRAGLNWLLGSPVTVVARRCARS